MTSIRAMLLSGGLLLGLASQAPAQFSMTIGNPYGGGISIGTPVTGYSSGYSSYNGVGPGLGYSNVTNSYANTGYLAGLGVIGGRYPVGGYGGLGGYNNVNRFNRIGGYSSGYSGITPGYSVGGYGTRPAYGSYSNSIYGSRSVSRFSPFGGISRYRSFRY